LTSSRKLNKIAKITKIHETLHRELVGSSTDRMHSALIEAKATLAKAQEDMTHTTTNVENQHLCTPLETKYTWMGVAFRPPDHPRS
jgi:hypothetical protein